MNYIKLVEIFEKVQAIPYKVCKFSEEEINEGLTEGDCRHKSTLLYNLLKKEGFEVKKLKVVFDWADLPLPRETLSILKAGTIWDHDSISVKIGKNWIKVDCTWDPSLEKIGFPVTKGWDGKSDTLQITNGKMWFYDSNKYVKDKRIKIVKEEAYKFADDLNRLFSEVRG